MSEYLFTNDALRQKAAADLGAMDEKSYDDFLRQAEELAPQHGITRVKLAIDVQFKPEAGKADQPYPPRKDDWDAILSDARTMCVSIPRVYLVDGAKYAIPI
jgi:hypothetical protein